jgi:small subunit ribosomal protein S16
VAVTLRLQRLGNRNRPFYRIVATDGANPRDGKYLEVIGTYNTLTDPPTVSLKEDRVKDRVAKGAIVTETVSKIIKKNIPNLLEDVANRRRAKIQARRKARKTRASKAK